MSSLSTDVLQSEAQVPCPHCGAACNQGVRARGVLIATCPPHGTFLTAQGKARDAIVVGAMDPAERLHLISMAFARFMVDPDANDFVALCSSTLACNQFLLRTGAGKLWAEVDGREWNCRYCGNRPLDDVALAGLSDLGFRRDHGEPNPWTADVPRDARALASFADEALKRAYGECSEYEVGVHFKRAAAARDVLQAL